MQCHHPFVTSKKNCIRLDARILEAAHRHARTTHDTDITSTSPITMTSHVSRNDDIDPARQESGFWSLPREIISTHILRSDFLPEPADIGRLRAVCRGMRDAVDATEREIKTLSDREAADLGHVSLLKDRHMRGVLKYECLTCAAAARNGDLAELKALRAANFPLDVWTCAYAAEYGHLGVLKWLREIDWREWPCRWDEYTCAHAALRGHLEVLKSARENGCPWDEKTCRNAAEGGYLEVLKWLRANGCPWDEWTCSRARHKGYVET